MVETETSSGTAAQGSWNSGQYFALSRNWYDELYHRPMIERGYFILLSLFAFLTIFFAFLVYESMFPLAPTVPYLVTTDNINEDMPVIRHLRTQEDQTLSESLAKFLIEDYVTQRETYNYTQDTIERRFNRVHSTSNDAVFGAYQRLMNPENRASPLSYLGRDGTRRMRINSTQFTVRPETADGTGTVRFTTVTTRDGKETNQSWQADIAFRLPPLKVDQKTNEVLQLDENSGQYVPLEKTLNFRVTTYEVREQNAPSS